MLFSEALRWCAEHEASWNFEFDAWAGAYVLGVASYNEEVAVWSGGATDGGWTLIEAVEQLDALLSATRPTFPELAPAASTGDRRIAGAQFAGAASPGAA